MPGLIRPEARAALTRWSGVLTALGLLAAGLWLALTRYGLFAGIGWILTALALALLWTALQRLRFAADGDAPGVVQIIEAEIRYYGPLGGGIIGLDALSRVGLSKDAKLWLVQGEDGTAFAIPRAADGAQALFDAFTALPGFEMEHALRALREDQAETGQILWQRRPSQALT